MQSGLKVEGGREDDRRKEKGRLVGKRKKRKNKTAWQWLCTAVVIVRRQCAAHVTVQSASDPHLPSLPHAHVRVGSLSYLTIGPQVEETFIHRYPRMLWLLCISSRKQQKATNRNMKKNARMLANAKDTLASSRQQKDNKDLYFQNNCFFFPSVSFLGCWA